MIVLHPTQKQLAKFIKCIRPPVVAKRKPRNAKAKEGKK